MLVIPSVTHEQFLQQAKEALEGKEISSFDNSKEGEIKNLKKVDAVALNKTLIVTK